MKLSERLDNFIGTLEYYQEHYWAKFLDWWNEAVEQRWCEFRGHPGIIFYNANGWEPNNCCTRCGKDLG